MTQKQKISDLIDKNFALEKETKDYKCLYGDLADAVSDLVVDIENDRDNTNSLAYLLKVYGKQRKN